MAWTETEKDKFYKRLAVLAEVMGEPLSPVRLAGYSEALEDAPFPAVLLGIAAAMRTCRFFPRPTEIRELGLESREWQRLTEAAREQRRALTTRHQPEMSPEAITANIAALKQAVAALASKRKMR